jgi:phage N-6-adenine-methyltransferase
VSNQKRGVVPFDPAQAGRRDAEADAIIAYAKRVKDWPLLEQAVDQKIEDQRAFVTWWLATVTPGTGGDRRSKNQRPRSALLIPQTEAEVATGIRHQQVSRWHQRLQDVRSYKASLYGAAWRTAMNGGENVRGRSGDNEWHTPPEILNLVRAVLGGGIDLDPASNADAQKVVRAKRFFTKADSGLDHPWGGRVFMNPPYGMPLIAEFVGKLLHEHRTGRVIAAILLTNDSTDTGWWHEAMAEAEAACFVHGRIKFQKASGEVGAPPQGQTIFYFGPDRSRFIQTFSRLGTVLMRAEAAESRNDAGPRRSVGAPLKVKTRKSPMSTIQQGGRDPPNGCANTRDKYRKQNRRATNRRD